eukprot:m51a1_g14107 putative ferritin (142) ;mRNA; r:111024-111614
MEKLIEMLNRGLEMEYGSYIQYLTHAELFKGPHCEAFEARFRELAGDEAKHAQKFRTLLADYLDVVPSMDTRGIRRGKSSSEILDAGIESEQDGIRLYREILDELALHKDIRGYGTFIHELRHILMDEEEHLVQLEHLKGV